MIWQSFHEKLESKCSIGNLRWRGAHSFIATATLPEKAWHFRKRARPNPGLHGNARANGEWSKPADAVAFRSVPIRCHFIGETLIKALYPTRVTIQFSMKRRFFWSRYYRISTTKSFPCLSFVFDSFVCLLNLSFCRSIIYINSYDKFVSLLYLLRYISQGWSKLSTGMINMPHDSRYKEDTWKKWRVNAL